MEEDGAQVISLLVSDLQNIILDDAFYQVRSHPKCVNYLMKNIIFISALQREINRCTLIQLCFFLRYFSD